jgi:hypothetical protein
LHASLAQEIAAMTGKKATEKSDPPPDHLETYLDLTAEEIARIVLCLLIEEALKRRLAAFRPGDVQEVHDDGSRLPARLLGNLDRPPGVHPSSRP